jgi:hypothetical protein
MPLAASCHAHQAAEKPVKKPTERGCTGAHQTWVLATDKKWATKSSAPATKAHVAVSSGHGSVKVAITFTGVGRPYRAAPQFASRDSGKLQDRLQRVVNNLLGESPLGIAEVVKRLESAAKALPAVAQPERTKTPQSTIGVTSATKLREEIDARAAQRGQSVSEAARHAFEAGFEALEERLWDESPRDVMTEYLNSYQRFLPSESAQWSLRLSRPTYIRVVMLAKEQGMSQSQLASWCIAVGLRA